MANEKEQVREVRNNPQPRKRSYGARPRQQGAGERPSGGNRRHNNNPRPRNNNAQPTRQNRQKRTPVRIIPLGGLNEIGKNMTVFECCNDMFILDCGLAFPDMDMPGVDIVIPDFTYVEGNKDKIRGIVITHGHEDHIGGLAYLLKKINVPIYGTRMTLGLIEGKLEEHGLLKQAKLIEVEPRTTVKMGCMAVEFIKVNHSIPGAVGMAIHTPAGTPELTKASAIEKPIPLVPPVIKAHRPLSISLEAKDETVTFTIFLGRNKSSIFLYIDDSFILNNLSFKQ